MFGYINLEIESIEKATGETTLYYLKDSEGKIDNFLPGQFITLLLEQNEEQIRRSYSIFTTPSELPLLGIAVKKKDKGEASSYLSEKLKKGDILKAIPPTGNFVLPQRVNDLKNLVFIGAGSGITPLFSMLNYALANYPAVNVFLIYGNRNADSIIFGNELNSLKDRYKDRFFPHHSLSKPDNDWNGIRGRIDGEVLDKIIGGYNQLDYENSHFFLCGPNGMSANIIEKLKNNNVPDNRIHRENYTVKIVDTDDAEKKPRMVTIIYEGKKNLVNVQPGQSILEAAFENNIFLPSSCQYGNCGTCKAILLSGKLRLVDQTALTDEELKNGYCLTCIGYPASDDVVIFYEDRF